jgi:hypothetical protein
MTHLNYECKVNFVKLLLISIYRCLKLIFVMPSPAATQAARSLVNPTHPAFPRKPYLPFKCRNNEDALMTDAVHTRACTGMKKRS